SQTSGLRSRLRDERKEGSGPEQADSSSRLLLFCAKPHSAHQSRWSRGSSPGGSLSSPGSTRRPSPSFSASGVSCRGGTAGSTQSSSSSTGGTAPTPTSSHPTPGSTSFHHGRRLRGS